MMEKDYVEVQVQENIDFNHPFTIVGGETEIVVPAYMIEAYARIFGWPLWGYCQAEEWLEQIAGCEMWMCQDLFENMTKIKEYQFLIGGKKNGQHKA